MRCFIGIDLGSTTTKAVVLDENSYRYFADGESFLTALISAQKSWQLNYLGAPFDSYLLSDLEEPGLRDYRFYLFLNTFCVTPAQRAAIHQRGCELLFLPPYSPDLTPIELAFSKIKQFLRTVRAQTVDALVEAIGHALALITPVDAIGYFAQAGFLNLD